MTRNYKHIFTFCCLFIFCVVQIKFTEAHACRRKTPPPAWTHMHHSDPDYFIGVGHSPVNKKDNMHVERARKDALNELASEISVNIFSSNVLITLVTNDKIYDEFNSLINARVRTDIEGYEVVDSYKDKKDYWVKYRLSKQKYYQAQETKRLAATQNALTFYKAALSAEEEGNYKSALINYTKTIDVVKLYLNEHILAEIDGKEENIVVKAYLGITSILTNLRFAYPFYSVEAALAQDIKSDYLKFQLVNQENEPLKGFPVLLHYSEKAVSQAKQITDNEGYIQFAIPKIRSNKQEEQLTVSVDMHALLLESSADYTVRKAIQDIPVQSLILPVYISKPSIQFIVDERSLNRPLKEGVTAQRFADLSYASDYKVVKEDADYHCYITIDTSRENSIRGIHHVSLKGQIVLKDREGNIKYSTQIVPVRGTQLSPERASEEAYKNFEKQIKSRYFREIEEAILR